MTTELATEAGFEGAYNMFVGRTLSELRIALLLTPEKSQAHRLNTFFRSPYIHEKVTEPVAYLAAMPDEEIQSKFSRVGENTLKVLNIALRRLAEMEIPDSMYKE